MKNKKFKALMIDCDGTLMEVSGEPTDAVIEAVGQASKLMHVGIATQRSLFYAQPILSKLKLSGPSIISGGAQIIDSQTGKILHEELIDKKEFLKAVAIIEDFRKSHNFKIIIPDYHGGDDIEWKGGALPDKIIFTLAFNFDQNIADQIQDKITANTDLAVHKISSHTKGKLGLSVTSPMATKQYGILEVAKILNIDTHQIIGIGNDYNDFPLLMACGLKVAVGNAVDDLKDIADYVAPTVWEDGVVDVINKFVL